MQCLAPIKNFIPQGKEMYNVRAYGAKLDDSTNDRAGIQAAVDAAFANGGGDVMVGGNAVVDSPILLKTNVRIFNGLPGLGSFSIRTTMSGADDRGIINIVGQANLAIESCKLISNGGSNHITSYGHEGLFINNVDFSGTTTSQSGPILLNGGSGSATGTFNQTWITYCYFHDLPNSIRPIRLYSRNGHTISNTFVLQNRFKGTTKNTITLDCYDVTYNTVVEQNRFENIKGDTFDAGTAVWTNSSITDYWVDGLFVFNNTYINTITASSHRQGFAYFYACKNVTIAGNRIIGSWAPNQNTIGPALAPGRIDTPNKGVHIYDNYIQGFDAAWDPDGQVDTDVHDNSVIRCGLSFATGYSIQDNVRVHSNTFYNSPSIGSNAMMPLGASTYEKNCRIYDNHYVDDRPIPTPTGLSASLQSGGSLTVGVQYYYTVTALDTTGETLASIEVSATPSLGNQKIRIAWTRIVGASIFKVYKTTTAGAYSSTSQISKLIGSSFTDDGSFALTAGSPPASSTVQTTDVQYAIHVHGGSSGGISHGDTKVSGNRFYLPNSTFTTLVHKEYNDTVLPRIIEDNLFIDQSGQYGNFVHNLGSISGAISVDRANGAVQGGTVIGTASITLLDGLIRGETLELNLTQDSTGSRSFLLLGNVLTNGQFVALTAANSLDTLTFTWSGSKWLETRRTSPNMLSGIVSQATAMRTLGGLLRTGDYSVGQQVFGAGYAVQFAGSSSSYIDAGNNSAIMLGETSKPLSLSMKVNVDASYLAAGQTFPAISIGRYYLRLETNMKISASVWSGSAITSVTTLVRGVSYDILFTYDGTTISLYVNGALEASLASGSGASGTSNLYLGKRNGVAGSEFKGVIDAVRIWNRTLTAAEATGILNNNAPLSGLVLEAGFDEQNTVDTSATGNVLTASGISYVVGIAPPLYANNVIAYFLGNTRTIGNSVIAGFSSLGGVHTATAFVDVAASTAATASARFRSGNAPTAPNDGDLWHDSTSKSLRTYTNGITGFVEKILYAHNQFNVVVNTASEASAIGGAKGVGSLTLPANFWVAGKRVQLSFKGTYQAPAVPNQVVVKIKVGSVVVAQVTVAASIFAAGSTVKGLFGEAAISCQSVAGGVAKLACDGMMTFEMGTGATAVPFSTAASVAAGSVTPTSGTSGPTATVDYTVANSGLVDVTETWSAAQAAQGTTISNGKLTEES